MIADFLFLMIGVYLHYLFPFSLLLLPLVFLPVPKFLKYGIIFLVIGTIIFFPSPDISGYHTVFAKVLSSNGNTLILNTYKVDNTKISQRIILTFSDNIYKHDFDHGEEVYFKGEIKKYGSLYSSRISTKDIGFLPSTGLFSELKHYYLSKISNCRNKDIISSLLLGYRSFNSKIKELLKRSGFSPIFAISGLHIGLIATIIYFIFYFLSSLWKKVVTILILLSYLFLIGFPLSAMRAVFMITLFLIFSIFDFPNDPEDIISLVGIFFILYDPTNVYNPGFLMSFFGALALILSPKKNFIFSLLYLFLFTFPLTSFFFSTIYIFSFLFQTIFVIPVITVFLIIGVFFLIFPFSIFLPSLDRMSDLIYFLMQISAKMPVIHYKFSIQFLILYYFFLFSISAYHNSRFYDNVMLKLK